MTMRIISGLTLAVVLAAAPAGAQAAPTAAPDAPVVPDAEIRGILADRVNAGQSVGIGAGVIEPTGRRVVAYGKLAKDDTRPLNGDTLFEIGSMTKVFTSLLLSDMVQRKDVALSDPVAKFLPPGVSVPARGGRFITLVDLSTHTSGLPRLPTNLAPRDPANPYADYTVNQLYQFLAAYQLRREIGAQYEYSNLGGGLLGHVLSLRAGMDYEDLVRSRVSDPLGMASTRITLSPELKARLATGHDPAMNPVSPWDMPTLAGAGALRSTVNDLLVFLAANLGYISSPLASAMAAMLSVRRPTGTPGTDVALGWHVSKIEDREVAWHNGGTGGYRSFMAFDPKSRVGVVVLSNAGTTAGVDDIGWHLGVPLLVLPRARTEVSVESGLLDSYTGRYQLAPDFVLTVTRDGDHLFVGATGQQSYEVFAEGPRDFFYKVVDAQITFRTDGKGRATALVLHQNGVDRVAGRIE
jgi:D-alanyl-D-alanine-carboxypeptidase/D-alanyl-D-alanine-endopeptidase